MEPTTETVIEAGRAESQYWKDIWRYRELFYYLAWRDMISRYKQTAVGVVWALVRPLLTMVILAFTFGKVANLSSGDVPYALFVFAAQLPWQFFASALGDSSTSLVGSSSLITKVYFPRLIIPTSSLLPSVIDLGISGAMFVLLMLVMRVTPSWHVVFVPLFIVLAFAAAMGLGIWMAALTVKYRDFRYITGFVLQFGLYVSPVAFDSSYVRKYITQYLSEGWAWLYWLNPMAGVIDGFRWALFGDNFPLYWPGLATSIAVTLVLVFGGIHHFRATERSFADTI